MAERDPARTSAALNILNFAWGLGAVACPALAGLAIRIHQSTGFFLTLAAAASLVALCYAGRPWIEASDETMPQSLPTGPVRGLRRRPATPVFAVIFFLYVGTENAISGWAAAYARRAGPGLGTAWVFAPSFFWVALLAGRAVAPAALTRVADARLRVFGLVTAGCGNFILLVSKSPPGIFAGVALVGLGLAPVFPLVIAALSDSFGASASRVAGGMFALGGLGGATLPWFVGFLSTRYGSLRFALAVPLASVLMMILMEFTRFKIPARNSVPA